MLQELTINGRRFQGLQMPTEKSVLLLLRGEKGFLGCGYFDIATANKLGEAWAIVRGVRSFDDMVAVPVVAVSEAAERLGLKVGMSGAEALALL